MVQQAGWPSGPRLSPMLYLSAQVSVGDAETADLLVLMNTFIGLKCKSVPGSTRKYAGKTAYVCRLTVRLTGRVVGRVGAHTGGDPLITMGEGFKSTCRNGSGAVFGVTCLQSLSRGVRLTL